MVNLVCVTKSSIPTPNNHYIVRQNIPLVLTSYLQNPAIGEVILTAIIKELDEPLPEEWLREVSWRKPQRVGRLEIIVSENSQFEIHEPVHGSDDSDEVFFGENNERGMRLQYLGHDVRRTSDIIAHTSVHHHEKSVETYHLLHGACAIELLDIRTGRRDTRQMMNINSHRTLTVPAGWQHSVVARYQTPSVMLIVTNPPNNSRDDHHSDGLFKHLFPDVIASYTQRTRGPSEMAPEAGNP